MASKKYQPHYLWRARAWQHRPELDTLKEWWNNIEGGVFVLYGGSGCGKTALIDRFLQVLPGGYPISATIPKLKTLSTSLRPFIFSFHQSLDLRYFFNSLSAWLTETAGNCRPRPTTESRDHQWADLFQWLDNLSRQQTRTLMVLDGAERLQQLDWDGTLGTVERIYLQRIISGFEQFHSKRLKIVVTSGSVHLNQAFFQFVRNRQVSVDVMDSASCFNLLESLGAHRSNDAGLSSLVEASAGHALTLDLIGGYIREFCDGDITESPQLSADPLSPLTSVGSLDALRVSKHNYPFSCVIEWYRKALARREPTLLAILERMSRFRLGIDSETLSAIYTGRDALSRRLSGRKLAMLRPWQVDQLCKRLISLNLATEFSGNNLRLYTVRPSVREEILPGVKGQQVLEHAMKELQSLHDPELIFPWYLRGTNKKENALLESEARQFKLHKRALNWYGHFSRFDERGSVWNSRDAERDRLILSLFLDSSIATEVDIKRRWERLNLPEPDIKASLLQSLPAEFEHTEESSTGEVGATTTVEPGPEKTSEPEETFEEETDAIGELEADDLMLTSSLEALRLFRDTRTIFISYSRKEKKWLNQLLEYLNAAQLRHCWSDQKIPLGEQWQQQIKNQLEKSTAAILLIGPAFLGSDYIRNQELPLLLQKWSQDELVVIPILIRPSPIEESDPYLYPDPMAGPKQLQLSNLQMNETPLSKLNKNERGDFFSEIVKRLKT